MAVDIAGLALDFIDNYGLYAIFVLLIMDGALMLPVFPGELVLVMAVAAYVDDVPSLVFLIVLTSVAGLLGSLLLYGITRGGGRRLVERFPRFFMMPRKRRERLERTFSRPVGQSLVFFLRLVPLTRVLVNIPAGLAKMPIVRFLVLSTLGLLAYHAGFLWFSYEVQREGSALATQKEELEAAYASPAMDFVEANAIITGAAVLLIGAVLSARASVQMFRDPEESGGSLVGWLATVVLFWGGLALAAATYLQPASVVILAEVGGVDVEALAAQMDLTTLEALFGTAAIMVFVGLVLRRTNGAAQSRRRRHIAEQKALERMRSDAALVEAVRTQRDEPAAAAPAPEVHQAPRPAIESDEHQVSSKPGVAVRAGGDQDLAADFQEPFDERRIDDTHPEGEEAEPDDADRPGSAADGGVAGLGHSPASTMGGAGRPPAPAAKARSAREAGEDARPPRAADAPVGTEAADALPEEEAVDEALEEAVDEAPEEEAVGYPLAEEDVNEVSKQDGALAQEEASSDKPSGPKRALDGQENDEPDAVDEGR